MGSWSQSTFACAPRRSLSTSVLRHALMSERVNRYDSQAVPVTHCLGSDNTRDPEHSGVTDKKKKKVEKSKLLKNQSCCFYLWKILWLLFPERMSVGSWSLGFCFASYGGLLLKGVESELSCFANVRNRVP